MILTINTQDLIESLNTVTRALAARPAKQILEGVLLEASDNRLTLTCSDGSFNIETTNAAFVEEEGQTVLPGRLLTELIRKLPGGEVKLSIGQNRQANIQCMKYKSNLSAMDGADYPEFNQLKTGTKIQLPQKTFKDMLTRVMFAMATDESRPVLTGTLLEVSHSEARVVAVDGFRLSIQKISQPFDLPDKIDVLKAIIPGRVINELSRILQDEEDFCTITIDKGRMQCEFGNTVLSSVLLVGEYIDYRRIISNDTVIKARANREDVLNAIDRASLMAREGKNNLIRMSFSQDVLRITSNAEMGDVEETVAVDLQGDDLNIAFNAKYITDLIRNVPDDDLYMNFKTSVSPCIVCPPEGDAGTGMTATNSVRVRTGNVSAGTSIFAMIVLEKALSKVRPELETITTPSGAQVLYLSSRQRRSPVPVVRVEWNG